MGLAPDEWQVVRFTLGACVASTAIILPFGLGHRVAARATELVWQIDR